MLPQLRGGEFATVSAAPGAGKTLFAAAVYRQLADAGDVGRMVVFVPNANLRTQWADDVKRLNVFLHTKGTTEKRSYDGVVIDLSRAVRCGSGTADYGRRRRGTHAVRAGRSPPSGEGYERPGWFVGGEHWPDRRQLSTIPSHRVLNLSGTLFRSNMKERISTINYKVVGDRIDTVGRLCGVGGHADLEQQLRHIKVLGFDADMRWRPSI